jgi:hypothetical protein
MNLENSIKIVASATRNVNNSLYNNNTFSSLGNSTEKITQNENPNSFISNKSRDKKQKVFQHFKLKSFEEPNFRGYDSDNYQSSNIKRKNCDSHSKNVYL